VNLEIDTVARYVERMLQAGMIGIPPLASPAVAPAAPKDQYS
jgi:hypothetical protein